jgi:hypothetical protein
VKRYVEDWRTCRVCNVNAKARSLIKYSTRHYAHPDCALQQWGAEFFNRLTPWQCGHQFPYAIAVRYNVHRALQDRAALDRSSAY